MEFTLDPKPSEEEMINSYVKTLASVTGSEEKAKKKIYSGWRGFYITKHNEMACKAAMVVEFLKKGLSSGSIEVGHYLTAIKDLYSMQFGFKDVQMFFLEAEVDVLLNLVGLHYCISWLRLPEFIPRLSHAADDLVFQGWDDPYVPCTHEGLLKWKYPEMNLVDFLFEMVENRQLLFLHERGKKKLMDGNKIVFNGNGLHVCEMLIMV